MIKLMLGKMEEQLRLLDDNSVDSIVTDPPYGIDFMGKKWDYQVPSVEQWKEALRVLKPGGHLISFSSARTYHRMAVLVEDAGFEIRDQIMWVYGSGFPKSMNIGKAYDKKRGKGAEKLIDPDFEMKHIVENWYEHPDGRHFCLHPDISGEMSFGAQDGRYNRRKIYIEQFRKAQGVNPNSRPNKDNIETNSHDYGFLGTTDVLTTSDNPFEGWGTALKPSHEPMVLARKPLSEKTVLANMERWGTGAMNIDKSRVGDEKVHNDRITTGMKNRSLADNVTNHNDQYTAADYERTYVEGRWPANFIHDGSQGVLDLFPDVNKGSAARFFYVPKVSKKDRNEGLDGELPTIGSTAASNRDARREQGVNGNHLCDFVSNTDEKNKAEGKIANTHPTVKPTDLMHYLIRMVTPEGGTVLDPFMGSGSTGKAAVRHGYEFIGIEMEEHSYDVAKARIEFEQ